MAVPLIVSGVQPLPPDSSTSLEELMSGIRFYFVKWDRTSNW